MQIKLCTIVSILFLILFISACSTSRLGGRGSLPCTDPWWDAQDTLNVSLCELTKSNMVYRDDTNRDKDDKYCRDTCIKELAYKIGDSKLCELITEGASSKGLCYDHVSIKTNDITLCYRIEEEILKKSCIDRFSD